MAPPITTTHRLVTVIAGTIIALACGTNYVYSAWAPQFADRMKLSSTESNLIGAAGNMGMYASGIPVGYLVDSRGPRPGTVIGTVAVFLGYFPIYRAFVSGPGAMGVPFLCFFSFLTGLGSCAGFSAAIKTAASNFPHHRGSATAFPLATFGLSAFFFSTVAAYAFRDDTARFLLVLAIGTSSLIFICSFFIRILPHSAPYTSVPNRDSGDFRTSSLHRSRSSDTPQLGTPDIGTQQSSPTYTNMHDPTPSSSAGHTRRGIPSTEADETSSLMARSSSPIFENSLYNEDVNPRGRYDSLHADLRGFAILPTIEFWQLFLLLGTFTGIGLMTINNIGTTSKALWRYYDDSTSSGFLQKMQAAHVSTISILSFVGRLLSGIGSDLLVKKFHMSRLWCIFASSILFCAAQLAGSQISNPHHLIIVSSGTGLAYGMLFGVFPSIVAHTFGVGGISQNWGAMTVACMVAGNVFNLMYGSIYDRNSARGGPTSDLDCRKGLECYREAYQITLYAGLAGAAITLWSIWHERRILARREGKEGKESGHERIA